MGIDSKITMSGILESKEHLTEIINYLEDKGVSEDDISILMSEDTKKHQFAVDTVNKAPQEAMKGLAAGGLLGAVLGGLSLIGMVAIPGIGIAVAGPIIGILTGGAAGGIVGSIIGALVGIGIPEYEAKFYEQAVKEKGNILLVTHIDRKLKSDIQSKFNQIGAFHIASH